MEKKHLELIADTINKSQDYGTKLATAFKESVVEETPLPRRFKSDTITQVLLDAVVSNSSLEDIISNLEYGAEQLNRAIKELSKLKLD